MHAFILRQFGFSWKDAFTDSAVANVLLGGTALLVSLSLQHYIPQKKQVWLPVFSGNDLHRDVADT